MKSQGTETHLAEKTAEMTAAGSADRSDAWLLRLPLPWLSGRLSDRGAGLLRSRRGYTSP